MKFFAVTVCAAVIGLAARAESPIRLTEVAAEAGVANSGLNGAGVAFADYDNDGDVDIYVSNADAATRIAGSKSN